MPLPEKSKRIICIADHDEDDRMLLYEALLTLNKPFDLIEISSREQLADELSKLSDISPDFIFLNSSMPGTEGVQYIEVIRNEARSGQKIKIIIYSSQSEREFIENAFELGADFYAVKPANYGDLKDLARIVMDMDWETLKGDRRIFHRV